VNAPRQSYVIWFSQRVGSTFLTQALEDLGIAGRPREWFNVPGEGPLAERLFARFGVTTAAGLRDELWRRGTTENGVLGIKYGMTARLHAELTSIFSLLAEGDERQSWAEVFPDCRHVFMTRRNKLRLAVSWWRAIQSGEWHRPNRAQPPTVVHDEAGRPPQVAPVEGLVDRYDRAAITHLLTEASLREADMQDRFDRWGVVPMTIVYEDLVRAYEPTVRALLEFLDVPGRQGAIIPPPAFEPLADEVSEAWVERFRRESPG
jgi:LPS sulfotransferase NodH